MKRFVGFRFHLVDSILHPLQFFPSTQFGGFTKNKIGPTSSIFWLHFLAFPIHSQTLCPFPYIKRWAQPTVLQSFGHSPFLPNLCLNKVANIHLPSFLPPSFSAFSFSSINSRTFVGRPSICRQAAVPSLFYYYLFPLGHSFGFLCLPPIPFPFLFAPSSN